MSFDWQNIGNTIYGILGVNGYRPIQMWDEDGGRTNEPGDAVRFIASKKSNDPDLETFDIMVVLHDENNDSHVDLETPTLANDEDFDATYKLKKNLDVNIKDRFNLPVNWTKFSHRIQSKDESMENIQESKDISKVYGPSLTTSYQKVGESKLIIRHSDPIDESKKGSRWRKIRAIFIETKNGERFSYPYAHVAGARAMARHLSNDGQPHDEIGEAIKRLSDDYIELKKAKTLLGRAGHDDYASQTKDAMHGINRDVKRMAGPRGYSKMITGGLDVVGQDGETADLTKKFIRDCNWTADEEAKPLATAARYISRRGSSNLDDGMVNRLNQLADKIDDEETANALRNMANAISSGEQPTVDQVRFATEAARRITESIDPILARLLHLGGVKA